MSNAQQSNATRIEQSEFEEFLEGKARANRIHTPGDTQAVYEIPTPKENITVRIFSTIENGISQPYGKASIKIVLWHTLQETTISEKHRAYRVTGWKANVMNYIKDLLQNYKERCFNWCDHCNSPMMKKEVGLRLYFDCTECEHTKQTTTDDSPTDINYNL